MTVVQRAALTIRGMLGADSWAYRGLRGAGIRGLGWLGARSGIPWDINGVSFRVDPRHYHVVRPEMEAPVAAFLRERVKPGAVCIDAGANVGLYALQFAHWSAPTGRVIAFEPNPTARAALERHVRFNGCAERVRIVAAAVGASRGEATLYAPAVSVLSRPEAPNPFMAEPTEAIRVAVVSLDEFCESEAIVPDWLLMDIEGGEIAALEGAKRLIQSRFGKLGIVVEMHPNVWTSSGTSREAAEALLAELQLRPVALTGQTDPLQDYGVVFLEFKSSEALPQTVEDVIR